MGKGSLNPEQLKRFPTQVTAMLPVRKLLKSADAATGSN
jgi:hypothetical protein